MTLLRFLACVLLTLLAALMGACTSSAGVKNESRPRGPAPPSTASTAQFAEAEASPLPTPSTPSASPGPSLDISGLTGRIVFDYEGDVWVMNVDGSKRRRLTRNPDLDFDAHWSPDGRKIAFRSHRDGNEEVYVMDADGSRQRNLTRHPMSDYSPAWSPDGAKIAFASNRDGDPNEIYVMHADGSHPTRLTHNPGIDEYPTWSPDGRQIAFACTLGRVLPTGTGDFGICVMNSDGSALHQIVGAPGEDEGPAWSPDGTRIAFQSNRYGWPTLPGYTPPSYEADYFGQFEIFTVAPDGSNLHQVTYNYREDDSRPDWSPDGHLMWTRYGALIASDAEGGGAVEIADPFVGGGFPDWWQPERSAR